MAAIGSGDVIFRNQREAFIEPAGDAADHHLDRPAERTQPYGRARGAVAMRAGAVDDEERLRRPRVHSRGRDLAVRQAERPADVTLAEVLGAAHIEQNESGWVGGKSLVDVPAIGLQPKQPL